MQDGKQRTESWMESWMESRTESRTESRGRKAEPEDGKDHTESRRAGNAGVKAGGKAREHVWMGKLENYDGKAVD